MTMTDQKLIFTRAELTEIRQLATSLRQSLGDTLQPNDEAMLWQHFRQSLEAGLLERDVFGLNPILTALQTAKVAVEETGLRRDGVLALILYKMQASNVQELGPSVSTILHGLMRITDLNKKSPVVESENFRNLLLSFAEDMRVILIMIADRVNLMRQIRDTENEQAKLQVSQEASYLYAPLAHKLGLYKLKSELEDLSLKYLEHDAYYMIKEKLNATKKSRDAYIEKFIAPIEEKLKEAGLKFHMKGRTKSIHSIWQKMKKQQCGFEGIYDLFAIRIILETESSGKQDGVSGSKIQVSSDRMREVSQCWQAFAIITNMYQGNPKRLRDWLTVPKSNGYESLHITVLGPEQKWVEVQIRTERMDEVAEGELRKFPKGATVLDFAYQIHSNVGNRCTGARINNKVVNLRHQLHSGDQVEIITSNNQTPKQDWLNIVKTSRAKAKVRQALKETQVKDGIFAKEMLERRMKNRKIEFEESVMNHTVKKLGFKETRDFYKQIADGVLDPNTVIEKYLEVQQYDNNEQPLAPTRSAEEFEYQDPTAEMVYGNEDVLVIDKNLKGVEYSLSPCCHPIYGDKVFGFVTINGGIKIHREDCPNAPELRKRFGYRIVRAVWSGKGQSTYSTTLRIIGNDDIGIVNNITSIISKEEKIMMRSINIDSHDGLFSGNLTVNVEDTSRLEALIKKLRTVKGVKQVGRL